MAKKKEAPPTVSDSTDGLKRLKPTVFKETGNYALDLLLTDGKGIPMGANIMLFGPPGTGKTTLFGDIIVRVMKKAKEQGVPCRMHYVDSESSRELLDSLGVMDYVYDKEEYAPYQVIYHEYVNSFDYLDKLYGRIINDPKDNWSRDITFVFVDSVTKLLAESQLINEVDKADFGDNAKTRKKMYGKWLSLVQARDITQFWTSQVSVVQNAGNNPYAEKQKPAVSFFDEHNMDAVLKVTPIKDTKLTDVKKVKYNTINGEQDDIIRYIIQLDPGQKNHTKNRYSQNVPIKMLLHRGKGIINAYTVRNILESRKYMTKNGSTYALSPDIINLIGEDVLKELGATDFNKVPRTPVINRMCSLYGDTLMEMIKQRGEFTVKIKGEEEDEDDGLLL